jgi:release factor glutamine methyltransferase
MECPLAQVTAVDISDVALKLARQNAQEKKSRIVFVRSHWFQKLAGRRFDIVVANPPYIALNDPHLQIGDVKHEPVSALVSGKTGLEEIQEIVFQSKTHLFSGGVLLIEHGYNQAMEVRRLLNQAGFPEPRTWLDLSGNERVTGVEMSE